MILTPLSSLRTREEVTLVRTLSKQLRGGFPPLLTPLSSLRKREEVTLGRTRSKQLRGGFPPL